jgi:hypothetical protein
MVRNIFLDRNAIRAVARDGLITEFGKNPHGASDFRISFFVVHFEYSLSEFFIFE